MHTHIHIRTFYVSFLKNLFFPQFFQFKYEPNGTLFGSSHLGTNGLCPGMLSNVEKSDPGTLLLLGKSPGWTPFHDSLPKNIFLKLYDLKKSLCVLCSVLFSLTILISLPRCTGISFQM